VKKLLLLAAVLLACQENAFASGFQLFEQNAVNLGDFAAGGAAIAEDASTAFYNPAGMTQLEGPQLVVGAIPIITHVRVTGSDTLTPLVIPDIFVPMSGVGAAAAKADQVRESPFAVTEFGTQKGGVTVPVPFFHFVTPLVPDLWFGLSIAAPFGLKTTYPETSYLRYSATLTELQTIDISPSLGWAVTNRLSVGLGFDPQYSLAKLNNVVSSPVLAAILGEPVNALDTTSTNKGHGWGYGWHGGLLYNFDSNTRIGVNYHSETKLTLQGSSRFCGALTGLSGVDCVKSHFLNANLHLPATTTISIFHWINPRWAILASAYYTQWDVFKDLALNKVAGLTNTIPAIPTTLSVNLPQNFHNTWREAVALNFVYSPRLLLRGGLGYDQTPTNDTDRSIRLPDDNRFGLSIGGNYVVNHDFNVDVGYTHYFIKNANINQTAIFDGLAATVNGVAHSSADLVGIQINWNFC
jgi:long-chain fatty acid transport protein